MVGGLSVFAWLEIWYATHAGNGMGGVIRTDWPDGGTYWSQPAIGVAMLELVGEEVMKAADRERRQNG